MATELLARRGVVVPQRTLHRYVATEFPSSNAKDTVRVADGEPGAELQVDFGKLGMMVDPATGERRAVQAMVFTACYSQHCFVWLTFSQKLDAVIAGFEAAWEFFNGVFAVVIPDNMATIVSDADGCDPGFNEAFIEYAQSRGFIVDPARGRSPQDKPRVERNVVGAELVLGRGRVRRSRGGTSGGRVVVPGPGRAPRSRHDPSPTD